MTASVAVLLALIASVALALAPTTTTHAAFQVVGPEGVPPTPAEVRVTHRSLYDSQGSDVLIPLSIPVVLATIAFLVRRWLGALVPVLALLWVFSMLGAFSIGLFYIPALVAMAVAVAVPGPREHKEANRPQRQKA